MNILKLILTPTIAFTQMAAPAVAGEPVNYCHDEATWQEWMDLVSENPGDDNLQIFHALRIGLCVKIEQGSIDFDYVNKLFNRAHESVIKQLRREEERDKRKVRVSYLQRRPNRYHFSRKPASIVHT